MMVYTWYLSVLLLQVEVSLHTRDTRDSRELHGRTDYRTAL